MPSAPPPGGRSKPPAAPASLWRASEMLQTIANAFTVPEIRRKIAFTAAMLLLYRLRAYIPAPGIDGAAVKDASANFSGSGNILGFLNLFSGGSLSRLSLFALGIMPYITA